MSLLTRNGMKIRLKSILALLLATVLMAPVAMADDHAAADVDKVAREAVHEAEEVAHDEQKKLDPKELIFEHLGDGYGWEVPFDHHHRIPLPVCIYSRRPVLPVARHTATAISTSKLPDTTASTEAKWWKYCPTDRKSNPNSTFR